MRFVFDRLALALVSLGLAIQAARANDEEEFASAAEHYRTGHWQQAADALATFVAARPDHPRVADARFYYGEALVQLGRWQEARQQFTAVLRQDAGGKHAPAATFRAGEAAYMTGDDATARRELNAFHRAHPDHALNAYALPYLGSLAMQARDVAAAEKLFADSLTRFPGEPLAIESQFGLAQSQQQLGKLEPARDGYRTVSNSQAPLAEQASLQLGAVQNSLADFAAALEAFDQFAKRFAESPLRDKARLGRGFALYKLGRYAEAADALQALSTNEALAGEAGYWLAMSQAAQENWQGAVATLNGLRVEDAHALAAAIRFQLGDAMVRSGDPAGANEHFTYVLDRHPASPWADDSQLGKIRVANARHDHEASVLESDAFARRFADSPLAAQAMLAKGQALAALDKPAEAIVALTPLVESQPPAEAEISARANATLAVSHAKRAEFDAARRRLAAIGKDQDGKKLADDATFRVAEAARTAGNAKLADELLATISGSASSAEVGRRAQSALAWNHFEAGRWAEAASACEALLAAHPQGALAAEAALLRGRALEHLEQPDAAEQMYNTVIEQHAESSRAAEALLSSARLNERLNRPDDAKRRYAELLAKHATFANLDAALFYYGSLLQQSDPEQSATLLERLRTEYPKSRYASQAALRLAEKAVDGAQYDEAEKLLATVASEEAPALRAQSLYLAGRLNVARGNWAAAHESLEKLLADDPAGELALPAQYLLAEACFRQGEYEQAAQAFATLSEKSAGRTDTYLATGALHRAQALAQLRRWDEASEAAREIAVRFPSYDKQYEADYLVARAFAAQADFRSAREWYAKVIDSPAAADSETAAMARWMTGESYLHQQDHAAALAEYLKVDDRYPRWHAAALLQAGKAQEALGRWQPAAELYQQLLDRYPAGDLSAEATRRLNAARGHASEPSAAKQRN